MTNVGLARFVRVPLNLLQALIGQAVLIGAHTGHVASKMTAAPVPFVGRPHHHRPCRERIHSPMWSFMCLRPIALAFAAPSKWLAVITQHWGLF